MKRFVRWLIALSVLAPLASAQTTPVAFPEIPLPTGVAGFAEFNQLGTPRWTMGVSAIYPIVGSAGIYSTTTADVFPVRAVDAATKKSFYAINASIRQGVHKDILDTGRFSFLVGGDVGPGFSQAQPSGIAVSLSGSFVFTGLYQISRAISVIVPVRMLHVADAGWNPIVEAGIVVNIKNLPGKK